MELSRIVTGRELAQGYLIPRWWGLSYRIWDRDVCVIHPVPINLVVRYFRNLWHWIVAGYSPSRLDRVFDRGYRLGRSHEEALYRKRLDEAGASIFRSKLEEYHRGWNAAFKYMEDQLAKRQH